MDDLNFASIWIGRKKEEMKGKVQGMRKWCGYIATFVLAVAVVCMLDVFSTVSLASTGKATSNAKIRKDASTNSTAVGSVTKGTEVEISGETKGTDGKVWYKVTYEGTTGYIRSDLLDVTSAGSDTGSTGTETQTSTVDGLEQVVPVEATITGGNTVRVRTSASTANSNNILTTAANGTKVTVVARTTGSDKKLWYQVKFVVNDKDVIGYVRYDYLSISGEVLPLTEENISTPDDNLPPEDTTPEDTTPEENKINEPTKRYETKLVSEKWYLLDYEENKQYDIDQVFTAAKEIEEQYNLEKAKTTKLKTWLTVFIIVAVIGCGGAIYLLYCRKVAKDDAYFESFNNENVRRTSDRPRNNGARGNGQQNGGREKPVIKEGLEPKRDDQKMVQNGQRQTQGRAQGGQRVNAQPQGGQRVNAQPQGQRVASPTQNGAQPQGSQRVNAQPQGGQRQGTAQPQGGQRMAGQQGSQRQGAQSQGGQRPNAASASQRPSQNRASAPVQETQAKPKNFVQDDEREFEFLNWDSDDE